MTEIRKQLFLLATPEYKEFVSKLIPNISKESIMGVKIPPLRALAKTLTKDASRSFLASLPHQYYEENNLHAFIIERMESFDECIEYLQAFLPYVDNWSTCDSLRPKCFKKNLNRLLPIIHQWLASSAPYTVRFGIEMLMVYYLDEKFDESYAEAVSKIRSDEYYVNMMISWYFATALAKQWHSAIKYLEAGTLPNFVHNKTIQKARESFRISDQHKEYLLKLK